MKQLVGPPAADTAAGLRAERARRGWLAIAESGGKSTGLDHGMMVASCRVNAQDTPAETKPDLQLEIAHILLIDVVGYSKLLVNEQIELLQELNRIVRNTKSFRAAEAGNKLIRVPTGDGMALLFFRSPEEPIGCALEITETLRGSSADSTANGSSQRPSQSSPRC